MSDFKRRLITGILAVALTFGLVGCAGDEDSPPTTTTPGGSTTSEPVGS